MDILQAWSEFKAAFTEAKADGKLTLKEIAHIAKEGGEFVAEVGAMLLTLLPADDDADA